MNSIYPSLLLVISLIFHLQVNGQSSYNQFFKKGGLRLDYFHSGNAFDESFRKDEIYSFKKWAGSKVNLIDTFYYGTYRYELIDIQSAKVIYAKGFDSYFKEYQTTSKALKGVDQIFHESALLPLPKKAAEFKIKRKNSDGGFNTLFSLRIEPASTSLSSIIPPANALLVNERINGNPNKKIDLVIIGEGYQSAEISKFKEDLNRFANVFMSQESFRGFEKSINIRGVMQPSENSGADEPRSDRYVETSVGATFNSLGSERYLLTEENKKLMDLAFQAPFDAILIMVNHNRYGGGGIYNQYCTFTTDNQFSEYLMVHEFGHSFFGLADEYYTSSTAYNDFYNAREEPAEPNITALLDPENVKWKAFLSPGIDLPTDWDKASYDEKDFEWQKRRSHLNDSIAGLKPNQVKAKDLAGAVAYYNKLSRERNEEVQQWLESNEKAGKVGAFEGAGYQQKGLYRPSINCIMFTRTTYFCPVCNHAISNTIEWHTN